MATRKLKTQTSIFKLTYAPLHAFAIRFSALVSGAHWKVGIKVSYFNLELDSIYTS